MSFDNMLTDRISVLKKDGTVFPNIRARVQTSPQKNTVFIFDSSFLIEEGDLVSRKMSNGGEETFEVNDPGFHEAFAGIKAHYQMDVSKCGHKATKNRSENNTYIITGNNTHINQNSIDTSTNMAGNDRRILLALNDLRQKINKSDEKYFNKNDALEVIKELEKQAQLGSPNRTIFSALLSALPPIESVTNIVATIRSFF